MSRGKAAGTLSQRRGDACAPSPAGALPQPEDLHFAFKRKRKKPAKATLEGRLRLPDLVGGLLARPVFKWQQRPENGYHDGGV